MPLQAPANYLLDLPNPAEQVQKDLQFYMNLQDSQVKNNLINAQVQEHQLKAQQQQVDMARQAQRQAYMQELNSGPMTADKLVRAASLFPEISEKLTPMLGSLDKKEALAKSSELSRVLATVRNKDLASLTKLTDELIPAYENAGRKGDAASLRDVKAKAEQGDWAGTAVTAMQALAILQGPEQFAQTLKALTLLDDEAAKMRADAKTAESGANWADRLNESQFDARKAQAKEALAKATEAQAGAGLADVRKKNEEEKGPWETYLKSLEAGQKAFDFQESQAMALAKRRQAEAAATKEEGQARSATAQSVIDELTGLPRAQAALAFERFRNIMSEKWTDKEKAAALEKLGEEIKATKESTRGAMIQNDVAATYARPQAEANLGLTRGQGAKVQAETTALNVRNQALADDLKLDRETRQANLDKLKSENKILEFDYGVRSETRPDTIRKYQAEAMKMVAEAKKAGKLSPEALKLIETSNVAGQKAITEAQKLEALGKRVELARARGALPAGWKGTFYEWLAKVTGKEDEATLIRKKVDEVFNAKAMENLPPGAASDADLAFAKKAFMDSTANPEMLQKAVEALGRFQRRMAYASKAYAEWNQDHDGPGAAAKGGTIQGLHYRRGESWLSFYERLTAHAPGVQ